MKIRPIVVTDVQFSDWYDVYRSAMGEEYPQGPTWLAREMAVNFEPSRWKDTRLWVAEDDGRVVGAAALELPLADNLERAEIEVYVAPAARRRGTGSALLVESLAAARDAGRRIIGTWLEGPSAVGATSGTAFASAHGFTRRITEIARVQRAPFDLAAVEVWEAQALARAEGYRIVPWRGRASEELAAELARLNQRMSTDAPMGELDYDEESWDVDRVRTAEERTELMGREAYATAAIAPDGSMAGVTQVVIATDSDRTAFQDLTIVDPTHRGHRLGLLVKAVNLRQLVGARPGVQSIWTWNADSNRYMIDVNEKLGYRVEGWTAGYQLDLPV